MGKLIVQTFSSEHPAVGTSRLRIAGRRFLSVIWEREGEPPVFGEAAPLEGYGDDDFSRAEAALRRLTAGELEEVARSAADAFRGELKGPLSKGGSALKVVSIWSRALPSPSARFCAEMLALSAVAGSCGVPLWRLLTSECTAPTLRTSAVIDPLSSRWFQELQTQRARGICTFKFKCGRDPGPEKEALLSVASLPGLRLRLDPNGALSLAEAERFLSALPLELIEWVEDPTEHISDWGGLRARTGIRLALDEPLARGLSANQASQVAPDVIVLKPMAVGGFSACVSWATWARARGASVCVSHLFDGRAAMSATIQLAFALQDPRFAAGLGEHAALSCDPSGAPPVLGLARELLSCPAWNSFGS